MTPRHRRGDRVLILGSGKAATVVRVAACRCGARDTEPHSTLMRDIWWREHMEKVKVERG